MVIDAARKGASCIWFSIIIVVPCGEWIYFFAEKIHDPEFLPLRRAWERLIQRRTSLKELRYRYSVSPTPVNTKELALRLVEEELENEALPLIDELQKREPTDKEARYLRAVIYRKQSKVCEATELLQMLVSEDPTFKNNRASEQLVEVNLAGGLPHNAVTEARELCKRSGRVTHALILARALHASKEYDASLRAIDHALADYAHSPHFYRRIEKGAARAARKFRKTVLGQSSCAASTC